MSRLVKWSTPALLALAFGAALAVPSLAAQPRAGDCWGGDCYSSASPKVDDSGFEVGNNSVEGLTIQESCLGSHGHGRNREVDRLYNFSNAEISASGTFDITAAGDDSATIANGTESGKNITVTNVTGKFVTPTKAEISLTIHYRSCGTKHVTILGHHH